MKFSSFLINCRISYWKSNYSQRPELISPNSWPRSKNMIKLQQKKYTKVIEYLPDSKYFTRSCTNISFSKYNNTRSYNEIFGVICLPIAPTSNLLELQWVRLTILLITFKRRLDTLFYWHMFIFVKRFIKF